MPYGGKWLCTKLSVNKAKENETLNTAHDGSTWSMLSLKQPEH